MRLLIPLALKFVSHLSSFRNFDCFSSFFATKIENISDIPVFERFHRLMAFICQPISLTHFLVFRSWNHSWIPHSLQSVKVFRENRKFFRFCFDFDRKEDRNTNGENHATFWQNTVCSFTKNCFYSDTENKACDDSFVLHVCMFSTADLEIKNVPNLLRRYHLSAICPEDI